LIVAYTGTPGSGKTYHAVLNLWERIKYGHNVIANIPLQLPEKKKQLKYDFWETWEITPGKLIQYSNDLKQSRGWDRVPEDYIYLVIDEAQLIFNCRNWNDKDRKEWVSFFTQHRKLGYKVILICQMARMLDKQIYGLLEYEIIHRKFSNFGFKGMILSLVFLSPSCFVAVRVWSAMNERIDCEIFRFHKRIAKLYDTTRIY